MQLAALKLHLFLVELVFDDVLLLLVGVWVGVILLLLVFVVRKVNALRDALARVELVTLELDALSKPRVRCILHLIWRPNLEVLIVVFNDLLLNDGVQLVVAVVLEVGRCFRLVISAFFLVGAAIANLTLGRRVVVFNYIFHLIVIK